jgi:hypothetical protein
MGSISVEASSIENRHNYFRTKSKESMFNNIPSIRWLFVCVGTFFKKKLYKNILLNERKEKEKKRVRNA